MTPRRQPDVAARVRTKLAPLPGTLLAGVLAAYMVGGAVGLAHTDQFYGTVPMRAVVIQAVLGLAGGAAGIASFIAGAASIRRSTVLRVRVHRRGLAIAAGMAAVWMFYFLAAYAS